MEKWKNGKMEKWKKHPWFTIVNHGNFGYESDQSQLPQQPNANLKKGN